MSNETFSANIDINNGCDESKCVSWALSSVFDFFDTPISCYADSYLFPMRCANGYLSHTIKNEPVIWHGFKLGTVTYPLMPYHYFTCCPPDLPPNTNVSRHCSNPLGITNATTDVCENDALPYARRMVTIDSMELYVCCDSVSNNNTTSFLNDTECIPFRDEKYSVSQIKNTYGFPKPISCDINNFRYPRKVEKEDNPYDIFHYECCKTESTQLPPFIQDFAFNVSIYPQIVVSSIAVFLCVLLIVALLIPLFLKLKKKREQTRDTITNTNVLTYGSYDLYLGFLAFPDLILNVCLLIEYGIYANNQKNPTHFKFIYALVITCSTANLYINCIISYEILNLLKNSNNIAKSRPPSLIKVTIQATVVYLFSIVVGVAVHYTTKAQDETLFMDDIDRYNKLKIINMSWIMVVSCALPIMFFSYVWITIWYQGYVKLSSVTKGMKELVCSFLFIYIYVYIHIELIVL